MFSSRLSEAISDAMIIHANQTRKGGIKKVPYICHILQVVGIILEFGGDEDTAISGGFHDCIEDQGGLAMAQQLEFKWGKKIVDVVRECTMEKPDKSLSKEDKVKFLIEQREKYLEHLPHTSEAALRVSCADKLHNLRSLWKDLRMRGEAEFDNFTGGKNVVMWWYWELMKAFKRLPYDFAINTALEMQEILMLIETKPLPTCLFHPLNNEVASATV